MVLIKTLFYWLVPCNQYRIIMVQNIAIRGAFTPKWFLPFLNQNGRCGISSQPEVSAVGLDRTEPLKYNWKANLYQNKMSREKHADVLSDTFKQTAASMLATVHNNTDRRRSPTSKIVKYRNNRSVTWASPIVHFHHFHVKPKATIVLRMWQVGGCTRCFFF